MAAQPWKRTMVNFEIGCDSSSSFWLPRKKAIKAIRTQVASGVSQRKVKWFPASLNKSYKAFWKALVLKREVLNLYFISVSIQLSWEDTAYFSSAMYSLILWYCWVNCVILVWLFWKISSVSVRWCASSDPIPAAFLATSFMTVAFSLGRLFRKPSIFLLKYSRLSKTSPLSWSRILWSLNEFLSSFAESNWNKNWSLRHQLKNFWTIVSI